MREQQQALAEERQPGAGFVGDLVLYTVARLGMVAVVVALLTFGAKVPLLVAAVVSVVVVMPLSMLVFGGLRRRVATGLAERLEDRRQRRAALQAQLRGEADEE